VRPTILLFDIDGTLIRTGGAGKRAIERAFENEHCRKDACRFRFDGMTDGMIVRQGLTAIGVPVTDEAVEQVLECYLRFLTEEVDASPDESYALHAGVRRAVELGLLRDQVAVGLGTGNILEGARIKLTRVNLYNCFRFGGFGSDHDDRAELIRVGAARGAAQLGVPLPECRVVVIGDTPRDVAAAKANGAEAVGVGTGFFRPADLMEEGATHAFDSLDAPGALDALFGAS
jgi:phosphoglycolate phosphatase-like HAD superfamily hydrolase